MTGFDRATVAAGYASAASSALEQLARTIPAAIELDLDAGRAKVDADAVRQAVGDAMPGQAADNLAAGLVAYASAGVVALPGGRDDVVPMPWLALEDLTHLTGGGHAQVRKALGIGRVRDGRRISARLHDRYHGLPDDVFAPPTAGLLALEPRLGRPGAGADPPDPPDVTPTGGTTPPRPRPIPYAGDVVLGPVDTSVSPDDVVAIAKCLLAGQWGPWWDDPFGSGWIPGFKVCIGYDCADALATYLLRFFAPSPTSLATALAAGIKAGQASAGVASLVSGFSMWVAVCTFITGFEITVANSGNSKRGVCLYCSWPWIGIPIFAVGR